jgi:hypothetical protein
MAKDKRFTSFLAVIIDGSKKSVKVYATLKHIYDDYGKFMHYKNYASFRGSIYNRNNKHKYLPNKLLLISINGHYSVYADRCFYDDFDQQVADCLKKRNIF